jgi:hypothetical protein
MNEVKLEIVFWGCLVIANVWAATGSQSYSIVWLSFAVLAWLANRAHMLSGFWSRVWRR